MGKDLHPSIMPFILQNLMSHQYVQDVQEISSSENYILRVTRKHGMSDVVVFISDHYHFGEYDYLTKTELLSKGGFILIAKPESSFSADLQENIIEEKVIIGKIGILLGALRIEDYWTYEKPVRRH